MKCLIAIAACLSLASPAAPADDAPVPTGPGTEHYAGWPPEQYKREFAAVVLFVANTDPYCGGPAPEGLTRYGCAWTRDDGTPFIVVLHPAHFPNNEYAGILAHEGAHIMGWPGHHPL